MSDPAKQLELQLRLHGFKLLPGKKHKVYRSDRLGGRIFVTASTPSDSYRWAKNALTDLRKIIEAPPRSEILAIEAFEREQAAQIGLVATAKQAAGMIGSGKGKKSKGTGYKYLSKADAVELTEEAVAERERVRARQAERLEKWKIERQARRDERKTKEQIQAEIEAQVNSGMEHWFVQQKSCNEDIKRYTAKQLRNVLLRLPMMRRKLLQTPEIIRGLKVRDKDESIPGYSALDFEHRIAAMSMAAGISIDETRAVLREALKNPLDGIRFQNNKKEYYGFGGAILMPGAATGYVRRQLTNWFKCIRLGADDYVPCEQPEAIQDEYFYNYIARAMNQAVAPSAEEIIDWLDYDSGHFDYIYAVLMKQVKDLGDGKSDTTSHIFNQHDDVYEIEDDIYELYTPLGLLGIKGDTFYVKVFPAPKSIVPERANYLKQLYEQRWSKLDDGERKFQDGWPPDKPRKRLRKWNKPGLDVPAFERSPKVFEKHVKHVTKKFVKEVTKLQEKSDGR